MRVVALFDVDGTLLTCRGAGRQALEDALADLTGRTGLLEGRTLAGGTDRKLARWGLEAAGHPVDEAAIAAVLERLPGALVTALEAVDARAHAGTFALTAAMREAGHVVGLGTGNVREGAHIKLRRVGFDPDDFAFGGFGDDDEDRNRLIGAGIGRGLALCDGPARVVVIGDSDRDVAAAKANGVACVAVRTSQSTDAQLAGADLIVDDLTDPRAWAFLGVGRH